MKKINFPIDKRKWRPSLIPGPIALISTYSLEGQPNIAPKSWLQMVSMERPILMFSGSRGFTTENNIIKTRCFGVNFVDYELAPKVFGCLEWFGQERIEKCGFTMSPASEVNAPLVNECKAHLECRLHSTHEVGSGFIVFGEIVAASINEDILKAKHEDMYKLFDQILFLEDNIFSRISKIYKVKDQLNRPG